MDDTSKPAKSIVQVKQLESSNRDCIRCKRTDVDIEEVPERIVAFLRSHAVGESIFKSVCTYCLKDFTDFVNSPSVYFHKKKIEIAEKVERWPVRTDVLKSGFRAFRLKDFTEAKRCYDEYIEIVCKSFDNMTLNQISSDAFKKYARAEEINTFSLVLWDLVVIADKYNDPELSNYATKLADLAKNSTAKASLLIAIRNYEKTATNRKLIRQLWVDIGGKRTCFIATYAFDNGYNEELLVLKNFRDEFLMTSSWGRSFVEFYYWLSPQLIRILPAAVLKSNFMRFILRSLAQYLKKFEM